MLAATVAGALLFGCVNTVQSRSPIPDFDHANAKRLCAHRGFSTIAPENGMAAFGAAVALGASEIEFDLWWTKDGEIVRLSEFPTARAMSMNIRMPNSLRWISA